MAQPTLIETFFERVQERPNQPALWCKQSGEFCSTSWSQLAEQVFRLAAGLVACNVQPGDRVLQLSENRHEWIVADLAIQSAGAVHVPVHAPLAAEQVGYQIEHSSPRVILVSTADQAAKIERCSDVLGPDQRIFAFEPCVSTVNGHPIGSCNELTRTQSAAEGQSIWKRTLQQLRGDSLATILYTSGTTGEPKGVMLSHDNLAENTQATLAAIGHKEDDLRLNLLPLSHIFARTCDLYTWIAAGTQLALTESRDTVLADCNAIQPTVLNAVPYFYDKVRRVLIERGLADTDGALSASFGGRVRLCCSGGAALPDHVFDFYEQRGLPILQGYGLTETSPVITVCTEAHVRRGSAGRALAGVEVRIAEDGEILTRGPHVMLGYDRDQAATNDILRAGWLHTGDLGHMDADGFLFITGRKKEILVTSGGKNVAPVQLESLLCEDPMILQSIVVGDNRNYLAALIVPDPDVLKRRIQEKNIQVTSVADAQEHPEVMALYQEVIGRQLHGVSHYEQVRRFVLLDRGFSIENGELTPKLSLRRKVIEENFQQQIETMYDADAS